VRVFRRAIEDLTNFFAVKPDLIACDLHPDYASTREAESLAARWNVPLIRVQHHHAHVAAAMAEHGLEGPVLGLAWDGTGLGTDGTIWGGEALLCEGAEFKRVAHLRTFSLPGGDRAASEPRRSALGVLHEIMGNDSATVLADYFSPAELNPLLNMLDHRSHCPRTSSMGRLFDAVAALCGLPAIISFEGQAAMSLEFAADENEEASYPLPLVQGAAKGTLPFSPTRKSGQSLQDEQVSFIADWEPMLRAVLADRAAGAPIGRISGKFHNALADLAVRIAQAAGVRQVVLTGGCFQNALLTKRVRHRLYKAGFLVYPHKEVPPGDGGIALGQIFVAARNKWLVASG
jgi:hydrogenase maturation protein HypF